MAGELASAAATRIGRANTCTALAPTPLSVGKMVITARSARRPSSTTVLFSEHSLSEEWATPARRHLRESLDAPRQRGIGDGRIGRLQTSRDRHNAHRILIDELS